MQEIVYVRYSRGKFYRWILYVVNSNGFGIIYRNSMKFIWKFVKNNRRNWVKFSEMISKKKKNNHKILSKWIGKIIEKMTLRKILEYDLYNEFYRSVVRLFIRKININNFLKKRRFIINCAKIKKIKMFCSSTRFKSKLKPRIK